VHRHAKFGEEASCHIYTSQCLEIADKNLIFAVLKDRSSRNFCRIDRTLAVDERSGCFFDTSRDVAVATNFVGKIDLLPSCTL